MPTPLPIDPVLAARIAGSTGQRLLRAARLLDERATAALAALPGLPPVRPAHTRLFPHLSAQGVRGTVLAERLGISKQAVSTLVADLCDWGLVELIPDPDDGRARQIRWTARGLEHVQTGLDALAQFEQAVTERVGPEQARAFSDLLDVWLDVLDTPDDDDSTAP